MYYSHPDETAQNLFMSALGKTPQAGFCACGRTELLGNHTDHQNGKVLASAVDLCSVASVSGNSDDIIRIHSDGFGYCEINTADLSPVPWEKGTTSALVRGVAACFKAAGYDVFGFDAAVASNIPAGSGLSSSAAFEVLLGVIINDLFNDSKADPLTVSVLAQKAENEYFGKPCGLMDQTASAVGGVVAIDFADSENPSVKKINVSFSDMGYDLCLIDTQSSHADLTGEYFAITDELASVCTYFYKKYLREVPEALFFDNIGALRRACGDRAVIRAMHVFAENDRVSKAVVALEKSDIERYLELVLKSGQSSFEFLQNVVPAGSVLNQPAALTLALAQKYLDGRGACRIHGGGFGGTIQAFVPRDFTDQFTTEMNRAAGNDVCRVLGTGLPGGCRIF